MTAYTKKRLIFATGVSVVAIAITKLAVPILPTAINARILGTIILTCCFVFTSYMGRRDRLKIERSVDNAFAHEAKYPKEA